MLLSPRTNLTTPQDCIGDLCYLESVVITDYLNQPATRKLLGVESPGNFTSCSSAVGSGFYARMDKYAVPSQHYVAGLLERGVRVLIYSGTYDWQCNWVASRLWLDELEWTGAPRYRAEAFRDWAVASGAAAAGQVKTAGLLTFATVFAAGHMISVSPAPLSWASWLCTDEHASAFTSRWTSPRRRRSWSLGGSRRRRSEGEGEGWYGPGILAGGGGAGISGVSAVDRGGRSQPAAVAGAFRPIRVHAEPASDWAHRCGSSG